MAALLRLRHNAQVGLRRLPATRILLLRLLIRHGTGNDYVITLLPIRWRSNLMLCCELKRIDYAQNLIEVPPRAHRVTQLHLDLLVGTDYEDGAHGRIVVRSAALRAIASRSGQHAVELGNLELRIADHRIVHLRSLSLFNIGLPLQVVAYWINAERKDFRIALGKFRMQPRHGAKLCGANRREVFGMGKQNRPS